jgi:hypothetical protein
MRRAVIAAVTAVVMLTTTALVACTPDVVPVAGAHPQPAVAESTGGADAVCGPDDSAEADRFMLTRNDIWRDVASVGQGFSNYTLDPAACAASLAATPNPEPVACNLNFPYFPDDEEVTELARIGVTGIHTAQELKIGDDGVVVSTMRETVLDLSGDAGAGVLRLASKCGAKPLVSGYATTNDGVIDMLLDIFPMRAVAVTFDAQSGLSSAQKQGLLARALSLLNG